MRRTEVAASAPAKINLSLGVGPVRPDGYHPLATVYQAIGLFDDVVVRRGDGWSLSVTAEDRIPVDGVPLDETNIAVRAAVLLAGHHGVDADVAIAIHKRIPLAGGLAGGSADGAATLLACDRLWGTRTPRPVLLELAGHLGSDVPFAMVGGTAIGSGRGELVTPAMTRGQFWWVVVESPDGLSTPTVYREFDRIHAGSDVPEPTVPAALMTALRDGDVAALGVALSNDLQPAALRLRPELETVLAHGRAASAHGALLSGSGPSCLFLCDGRAHAARMVDALRRLELGPVTLAPGPVSGARVVD